MGLVFVYGELIGWLLFAIAVISRVILLYNCCQICLI